MRGCMEECCEQGDGGEEGVGVVYVKPAYEAQSQWQRQFQSHTHDKYSRRGT